MNVPMVCQKFTAKKGDEIITYRGCQLDGGKTDICKTVEMKAGKEGEVVIESCETCKTDGCNKSSTIGLTSLWMLLIPFILKRFV